MRYIPNTEKDCRKMLAEIGVSSVEDLLSNIPKEVRIDKLNLPSAMSEPELLRHMNEIGRSNINTNDCISFLGAGIYNHFIPSIVDSLISRAEFYTSYTPYQPEISQGTLQGIFEFQSMICKLTGMEVSNASMYDGASSLAEAVLMAHRINGRDEVILSSLVHPEYIQVIKTYLSNININIKLIPFEKVSGGTNLSWLKDNITDKTSAVVLQNPNFFGVIEDLKEAEGLIHKNGALFIVNITEFVSLGLLKQPGAFNADIVTGEGQSFGNPQVLGGPHVGIFASKKEYIRNMPGRIIGQTVDKDGKPGYVLTVSTREQHIRREKATSNICSNESLCALSAAIHMSALGEKGIAELALLNAKAAHYAKEAISKVPGLKLAFKGHTFNEFVVTSDINPAVINKELLKHNIIGGLLLSRFYKEMPHSILFCATEMVSKKDIDHLVSLLKKI